jgi:Na+/H+ antiporter NhaC
VDSSWLSIVPPLLAISLSLVTRKVVVSMATATVLGALIQSKFSAVGSLTRLTKYAWGSVTGSSHLGILAFSLLLGSLMGMMQASGEQERLARLATRHATTRVRGQLATWILGLVIFFDDYVNTLVVGSTMRPIYDRLRISREKLAFLVDATAAPVVSLAVVSSWIAVEIGHINEQYAALGLKGDGLVLFVRSLPYRFYPWFMLVFGFCIAWLGRDFGPMLQAERAAAQGGDVALDPIIESTPTEVKGPEILAALPIICLVFFALVGMWLDGHLIARGDGVDPTLRNVFARSRSHVVLVGSALAGNLAALWIARAARRRSYRMLVHDMVKGVRRMLLPCSILVLAWSLSSVCRDLGTANYLIQRLGSSISPGLLPAATFVIAAVTSFATGTSWGTMAILFPIVIPLAFGVSFGNDAIMLGSISSILAGSVWGDHCSPISDTTIMSSLASDCDHMSHVKTQLPYALVVGAVSLVLGDVGTGLGLLSPGIALVLGSALLLFVVRVFGRTPLSNSHSA